MRKQAPPHYVITQIKQENKAVVQHSTTVTTQHHTLKQRPTITTTIRHPPPHGPEVVKPQVMIPTIFSLITVRLHIIITMNLIAFTSP